VGPFVFYDQMGPARSNPAKALMCARIRISAWRPSPICSTARWTIADTLGVHRPSIPGAVNLMTAGRGIAHSERTGPKARADGHSLHGIQVWIALPTEDEEIEPEFRPSWR
jgi:hypothetical protein